MVVEQHTMRLLATTVFGVQHWRCPVCGREFLVRWLPGYQRLVLREGDTRAEHVGAVGDDKLTKLDPEQAAVPTEVPEVWQEWLHKNGMTWSISSPTYPEAAPHDGQDQEEAS